MKLSDHYIAMAIASDEIQAMRPKMPESGSGWSMSQPEDPNVVVGALFVDEVNIKCLHWDNDEGRWMIGGYHNDPESMKWIPRLDDLAAMLGGIDLFTRYFHDIGRGMPLPTHANIHDWHECAISMVMYKKYNKSWDGKEWRLTV